MDSEILQAIILGIVQGLTEFFPVSSTAHLILFPWFFGWHGEIDTLTFDVALHGGTLCALIGCFYKDWVNFLLRDRRMLFFIGLATVPAALAGIVLKDFVEHSLRSPFVIVFSLIGVGVLMLLAEKHSRAHNPSPKEQVSLLDSLSIGVSQAMALVPGVSRSGITITTGLFRNLTRQSAAKFSFLLSTPVIGGATLLEGRKLLQHPEAYHLDIFAAGFVAALVSGFCAIQFLLRFLKKHPLNIFVYYRFLLAVIIVGFWVNGYVSK